AEAMAIPDNKGEHPMQPLNHLGTPATVPLENDFRVRPGPERDSLTDKLVSQLNKVINFTVENDYKALVSTLHRLITRRQVYDGKAAVSEKPFSISPLSRCIRSAVSNRVEGFPCLGKVYYGRSL